MLGSTGNDMYYVYILKMGNEQLYTGFTKNLKRRMQEHNGGKADSTKRRLPLTLIHYEAYLKESDARRREEFLKKSQGKRYLKLQIRDCLAELGSRAE